MQYPKAQVVIGGTNDGRRFTVLHGGRLSLPIQLRMDATFPDVEARPVTEPLTREEYREFKHGIGGQAFSV